MKPRFVPVTPAGTPLVDLERTTEAKAWKALMRAAAHMPYPDQAAFEKRGYYVAQLLPAPDENGGGKES